MSGELLLELLSEEIPARMQRRAIDDLIGLVRDKLAGAEIPPASLAGHVTPRRLAVVARGIPATQPDRTEERRGPRVGAPEAAIGGFLRAAGLTGLDQCEVRATERGEFYFAVIRQQGRKTVEILPELLLAALAEMPWPKSMRFPAADLRWVRPLNSAVCLFDGKVVKLSLGEVPVGRVTCGHRFLAPQPIEVADAADYLAKLGTAYVVLDRDSRRQSIADGLAARAAERGVTVKPDAGLLDEVAGLAEYPVVLSGSIDPAFMDLPPEVLATAMRTHQKYFSCLGAGGRPAPHFLFVANNKTEDGGKAIVAGNERVLRARLSDARFFWDQDRKVRLEDRVLALRDRVFHARLGSVYDKVGRVEKLAEFITLHLHLDVTHLPDDVALARRAALLAKADLSTGMVGEFPELQGVMGRYYALNDGEDPAVADAIADHYKPLGPNDTCPAAPVGIIVALADKIDTLAAFFAIGEPPTGSRDPFALRRAAQGIIRIIIENKLRIPLATVFRKAREAIRTPPVTGLMDLQAFGEDLLAFIADRLKVHLRERGVRHDLIAAAFAQFGAPGVIYTPRYEDDLVRLLARVDELKKFLDTDDGANLLTAYRRASNIVRIEETKDQFVRGVEVDPSLLNQDQEQKLFDRLIATSSSAVKEVSGERFDAAMAALARLRQPVDEFFEHVTVNVDDKELRENRLRLLSRIRATMNQVADFSQIEG